MIDYLWPFFKIFTDLRGWGEGCRSHATALTHDVTSEIKSSKTISSKQDVMNSVMNQSSQLLIACAVPPVNRKSEWFFWSNDAMFGSPSSVATKWWPRRDLNRWRTDLSSFNNHPIQLQQNKGVGSMSQSRNCSNPWRHLSNQAKRNSCKQDATLTA